MSVSGINKVKKLDQGCQCLPAAAGRSWHSLSPTYRPATALTAAINLNFLVRKGLASDCTDCIEKLNPGFKINLKVKERNKI